MAQTAVIDRPTTRAGIAAELEQIAQEIARRKSAVSQNARLAEQLRQSVPPVFSSLRKPSRYKGIHGGRGKGASWTFARLLLADCLDNPGTRAVCIREIQQSLKESVKRLLEDTIDEYGLGELFPIYNTHIVTPGNGIIIFIGMQNHTKESVKSLEGYNRAWVEEGQSLSQGSLNLLRPTIREPNSEIWVSWNPEDESDPVDVLLRGPVPPVDAIVIEANFDQNPYFPAVLQQEMERDRSRDVDLYNHIWRGGYNKKSLARVFNNWRVEAFETPPATAFLFGGDWGFSVDPTVLVRGYVVGQTLYLDWEAWSINCEIDDTPWLFDSVGCLSCKPNMLCLGDGKGHGMARAYQIVADSARPETISYVKRHGYSRIEPAKKGPGSLEDGVKFLQSYDIVVHPRCVHCIDELTNYKYKTHPKNEEIILPILADAKNHTIDAIRYMLERLKQEWVNW